MTSYYHHRCYLISRFRNRAQINIGEHQAKLNKIFRKPYVQHMCALSPPIPTLLPGQARGKPAISTLSHYQHSNQPTNQPTNQKGQAGLVPRSRPPAGVSTPPVNALRILSLSDASQPAPFPADSSNDRLSPPRGPRARRTCPQGPGRRTSRLPPPIQVRPTPRSSTNPRLQALPYPGPPPPKPGEGRPPQRGLRAREAPAGRAGRTPPPGPGSGAERRRGPGSVRVVGPGPRRPLQAGGGRGKETRLGGEPLTSLSVIAAPPGSGSVRPLLGVPRQLRIYTLIRGAGAAGRAASWPRGARPRPPRPSLAATSGCRRREEPPPPARTRQRRERRR